MAPLGIAEYRALLKTESETMLGQLDTLTDQDWRRQSPCEAWDVLRVVVHLQLGTLVHTAMVENGLAGRLDEPPWNIPEGIDARTYFQQRQDADYDNGPAANVALLKERLAGYLATLERVTDADLDKPAWFYGLPGAHLRTPITAFINDLIIHASDIRRSVGLSPLMSEAGSRYTGQVVQTFMPLFVTPERLAGAAGVVRQVIDGVTSYAVLSPAGVEIVTSDTAGDAAPVPDATITSIGQVWTLIVWRGLSFLEAEEYGRLSIDGDRALVERYLGAIKAP